VKLPAAIAGALPGGELAAVEERLDRFMDLALRWNRSIQFMATGDRDELFERHVVDSLAVLPHLADGWRLVDVGAGGGFPGAIVALTRPDVAVTSLEPIHKKQAFLATVKRELGLANYRSFAERDDAHRRRVDFEPYDAAVSRATFAVPEWLERGLELVVPGGLVIAMEGREQHELPTGTERVVYPLGDRQRALLLRRRP
jgi:16S rRNA (guanine527-N7)-methyltransferase